MNRALADTPGFEEALAFVENAYDNRLQRSGRMVQHPLAVAALLAEDGYGPAVAIAGLLHDVLEDTETAPAIIQSRFGEEIARLVRAVTQDPTIHKYRNRKRALRQQILDAGPEAVAISLADKTAKLRVRQIRASSPQADPLPAHLGWRRPALWPGPSGSAVG